MLLITLHWLNIYKFIYSYFKWWHIDVENIEICSSSTSFTIIIFKLTLYGCLSTLAIASIHCKNMYLFVLYGTDIVIPFHSNTTIHHYSNVTNITTTMHHNHQHHWSINEDADHNNHHHHSLIPVLSHVHCTTMWVLVPIVIYYYLC